MSKLIGTLFCLLLAAQANAITQVETPPGAPLETTVSGSVFLESAAAPGVPLSDTTTGLPVLGATNEVNSTLSFPAMHPAALNDSVQGDRKNSRTGFMYGVNTLYLLSGTTWIRARGTIASGQYVELRGVHPSSTLAFVATVKENAAVGAGDDLFPLGFQVDAFPVAGSLTNNDYARGKVDAQGRLYINGGEDQGANMGERGIGVFGGQHSTGTDNALRPKVIAVGSMDDAIKFGADLAGGFWAVAGPTLGTVNGLTDEDAAYARIGATLFDDGTIASFASFVHVVALPSIPAGTNNIGDVDIASELPAGTKNIGDVDVLTLPTTPAGTNYIGRTGKRRVRIAVKPTITAGAYGAADALGGLLEFTNAVAESGIGGKIISAHIVDDAGQSGGNAIVLFLFNQTFTPTADNDVIAISEADMENTLGHLKFDSANAQAPGAAQPIHLYTEKGVDHDFVLVGTSLFGQLSCLGTPTYPATDDITVILIIEQD